ncbi:MAG: type II secretion system protein [Sulfuricurvum sp.]|uniref:type II secretion system protein n=1 Tax=Sulfuricurvum sp. TaxID=2025608 RepID=UPI002725A142|nr:type II secretion system protein [Sulfuricurvum sp.]MDO9055575.1 type II secretion system protein [Sulfuricurvum sp.]
MRFKQTSGFTMIELLFVIVIMGLIGGIALETIRQYYEGIYRSQIYTQRVNEADHILEQLAKQFENAIELSIVNMDQDTADGALAGACVGEPIEEAENVASDYTVAFVGVDTDSLRTVGKPGWSENAKTPFTGNSITMEDANLSLANIIISALYPASNLQNSAIYNHQGLSNDSCADFFTLNGAAYYTITGALVGDTLPLAYTGVFDGSRSDYYQKKYLLRTGYAFRVLDSGEFVMFSNFRPWKGESYTTSRRSTLGQNVASFYADYNKTNSYNDRGSVWRLKVCMQGLNSELNTTDTASQAICRERRVHVRY